MVPDEGVCFLLKAPAQHVTEAIHRISLVTAQVNALFWSTQWSTQIEIFGLWNEGVYAYRYQCRVSDIGVSTEYRDR